MERRFRVRLEELLADAEVPPGLLRGVLPRLEAFLEPFAAALHVDGLGSTAAEVHCQHPVALFFRIVAVKKWQGHITFFIQFTIGLQGASRTVLLRTCLRLRH